MTVGFPATVVVIHVFAVQSVFVVASVENPDGIVVIVKDIESAIVVACVVVRDAVTDGDAGGTEVGWPSEPIIKDGKVKGGGMTKFEGGSGEFGMIIIPLYPEAHKFWHGQIGSIVGIV
jgi:hypothetical protein